MPLATFTETQRKIDKGKMPYPIIQVVIHDWQTAEIYFRSNPKVKFFGEKTEFEFTCVLLKSMQRCLAGDDGFAPDFLSKADNSTNTIVVTGNIRNCLILLRHIDAFSPIFAHHIFNWFQDYLHRSQLTAEDFEKLTQYQQSFSYYQREHANSDIESFSTKSSCCNLL